MEQSRYTTRPIDAFEVMRQQDERAFGRRARTVTQPEPDAHDQAQTWAIIALGGMIAALMGAVAGTGLAL